MHTHVGACIHIHTYSVPHLAWQPPYCPQPHMSAHSCPTWLFSTCFCSFGFGSTLRQGVLEMPQINAQFLKAQAGINTWNQLRCLEDGRKWWLTQNFVQSFSKWHPQISSISVTWKLVKNKHHWTPPHTFWIRNYWDPESQPPPPPMFLEPLANGIRDSKIESRNLQSYKWLRLFFSTLGIINHAPKAG